ncbi:LLM class flavin-dependent oxidoreductase [Mesorhizobium sp. BAC0120]|uniref:LLM class flavin-dependent oxidoreductase n=1 Tax=Mesorhizobium sp. BAC0120 TaxID=3090670 RepID=UPI00298D23FE|nr:LLM class flavin-dependent oxidoreductase [Mesorhizobium sp. BAC0120]MDW6023824.1 LLM class flavin-dependent oxidoreductase [Mesorhizobium sp. BAC0120]
MSKRQMHLIGYVLAGPTWHHYGSWRHPESDGLDMLDPARYEEIARVLEHGKFDGLFFVDFLMLFDSYAGGYRTNLKEGGQQCMMDPMQLLAAMARVTSRIGLASTMSTTFYHPFHIARAFASLDHISKGRAGWNVVTSAMDREAKNFGMDALMDKNKRYDMADEVLEACNGLWKSWEPGAVVGDRDNNVFADPEKVHYVNYQGNYVRTSGPLTVPSSPQVKPVIMQAGSSPRGREFAGRWAEVIFTLQNSKEHMQAFYRDIKDRVVSSGRRPNECAIVPAVDIVLGDTESIAKERAAAINEYASPTLGVAEISNALGVDMSKEPLDKPLEDLELSQGCRGILDVMLQGTKKDGLTLGQAGKAWATSQMTPQLIGTPKMIADHLQDFFEAECCDGFMICPSISPGTYVQFVKTVVPELQRRGIFRKEYQYATFRENLQN